MFHIVIGCDATGKSTLCRQLSEKLGIPIHRHMVQPKTEEECESMFYEYQRMFMEENNVIFDRTFYCEQVYGPIFRGKSFISDEQARMLEDMLIAKGAIVYYCYDEADKIIDRFKTTGEKFTKPINVRNILKGYADIIRKVEARLPVVYHKI